MSDIQQSRVDDSSSVSREARSKRLKCIRDMIKMSRREFCEKYNLSPGTLQNWEKARFGGLTEKGARRMIEHFKEEGVYCTFKWLMYGEGHEPSIIGSDAANSSQVSTEPSKQSTLHADLNAMNLLHPNSVAMTVNDDSMMPLLEKGAYVMGRKYFNESIKKCAYKVCVVETAEGVRYIRLLKPSHAKDRYNLFIYNAMSQVNPSCLFDVELVWAAPVFWIRRPC